MARALVGKSVSWPAAFVVLAAGCGSAWREQPLKRLDAPPGPLRYSVDFTTNQHGRPESTCTRSICQKLLAAISNTHRSIDFAVYGIRSQTHEIDALVAAEHRGVRLRG